MRKKHQSIQLVLLLVGIFLILITYFIYPSLNKTKITEDSSVQKKQEDTSTDVNKNTFENLQYEGLYDFDKPFTVKSEKAYILTEDPDIVYMTNMHVILYLNDGRVVNIVSDKGRYNKISFDCFFRENVKATEGNTMIVSDNLDLLATENSVVIYNNVSLNYATGSLQADKINYDFDTKHFKVSMFDDSSVKMKVIK